MCDLLLTTTTLINKTFFYSVLFLKLHRLLATVQRNEPGGRKEEQKNNMRVRSVELSQGRAEPRPGEGSGNGPKQHSITSLISITHSITPPGTVFQTGTCRATRSCKEITEPSGAALSDLQRGDVCSPWRRSQGGASSFRLAC